MYQFFYSDSTTKEKDSICVLIIFFTISLKLAGNFSSLFSFVFQLFRFRHNPLWYQISKVFDKKTSSVGKPGEALCRRKNLTNQVAILIT